MILASHGIIGSQIVQFSGLLDTYTGAAAAYSLRLLSTSYTGSAIKVRRASDNTEQDIGFVNNVLDTTTLASFCSGTNGFVTTWYDQSGNGFNATQTTAANQPKIYDSSTGVITENGKAAVEFDGVNDYFYNASSLTYSGGVSWYGVQNVLTGQTSERLWCDDITGVQGYMIYYIDGIYQINNGAGFKSISISGWLSQQQLASWNFNASNGAFNSAFNGSNTSGTLSGWSGTIGTSGTTNFGIMSAGNGGQYGQGKLQELVVYGNNQSSNRTGIETNINDYYAIY